ncbi:complex I assembly factor TIMMDC1, mitochondrial isoform X2 [Protopterus annectens]|nr:complex I assembly factor TIMMDC1, mitochondrial isoform X2 [Protopterus annectens]
MWDRRQCPENSSSEKFSGMDGSRRLVWKVIQGLLSVPKVFAAEDSSDTSVQGTLMLPAFIGKPAVPESGWDRIKELFERDEMQACPEELTNIVKGTLTATVIGMLYGGVPAARHARQQYMERSKAEIYGHRVEAIRSAHNAAIRGFIRYGWRWGWRVAAFVTIFNTVSTGMAVYRDSCSLGHFVAAGAVTGGLFRLNLGLGGIVGGTIIGSLLGVPAGVLIVAMQKASGETVREKKRRERKEIYELKVAE